MHRVVLILAGLLAGDVRDYSRPLDAKKIDQATLDAESYGEKKKIKREEDGLRITVGPGELETGWKTPQALKVGGDFTVTASFLVRKLPKPAQEDGSAIGLAIASQNLDQPDLTLVRLTEINGTSVYRSIDKPGNNAAQQGMVMQPGMAMVMQGGMGMRPGGKLTKPPRNTFPAKGDSVVLELRREGPAVSYYVLDGESTEPRYLGQTPLGTNDIAGLKLFVSNRNGAEAMDVVLRSLTIRAERITGLGTEVRTVSGEIIHGEPTAIEDGKLVIGGPPKPPPSTSTPKPPALDPAALAAVPAFASVPAFAVAPAPAAAAAAAAAPAPATAPVPAVAAPTPAPAVVQAAAAPAPAMFAIALPAPGQGVRIGRIMAGPAPIEAPPGAVMVGPGGPAKPADAAANKPAEAKKVPLDELEWITFERASTLSGRVAGQPNLDFTMPAPADPNKDGNAKPAAAKPDDAKPAAPAKADDVLAPPPGTAPAAARIAKLDPKPNGIRDLHMSLSGLRKAAIKQVTVSAQTDKGATNWRLDTSDSHDWPLVLRRAGNESWADLFLEPPPGDLKGKALTVNVTYQDGQNGNATIQAEQSTDPKLAFDPKIPAPSFDARVYLTGGEQLFGKFEGLGSESLRLRTPWGDPLVVPLAYVAGVYMGLPEHKESTKSFERRLRNRGVEDLLLGRSNDGEVVAISGVAEGTEGDKLRFQFQEKVRTLSLKQVEGLVLAMRPEPERPEGLRPTFSIAGGLVVSGLWKTLDAKTWKIETAWGEVLDLPAAEVRDVRFRGGRATYLSDLAPSKVEETPYLGRRNPWRKDVNLFGAPLKMAGRTYDRGLAVHSRSALTYDLNGHFATFEALVGFDESAKGVGRVDCRVFADDKEIYANPDLHADAPPSKLSLPVAGAERLKLVIDFGPDQDTGDRVIWANARLLRKPPQTEPRTSKPGSGE